MNWQLLLTLIGASIGIASGAWLCYPTAAASPHALAWVANPPWKSAEGMTELAIAQSAQYWIGGALLALAFFVQVAAALAPSDRGPLFLVGATTLWLAAGVVVVSILVVGLTSWAAYRLRKKGLRAAMERAAVLLAENPRITPLP